MADQRKHIVVLGGGYAGTVAANHLRVRADVNITLVNPRPVFVERIRLHQFAAGTGAATVDYGTLLGRQHRAESPRRHRTGHSEPSLRRAMHQPGPAPRSRRLVTRQALNALRADARRRESYVGPWLPEPLLLDENDASTDVVLAESVSMAMLVVLETLSPDERAVFVLREVFGFDYDQIGAAVGKSVAAARQVAHRARNHVRSRRRRFTPADPKETARITAEFLSAAATGDVQTVVSMLAPEVVWTADGGGKATAARRPVVGADKVAKAVIGVMRWRKRKADVRLEMVVCTSAPAVVVYRGDHLEGVFIVQIADGLITNLYAMRNPDKLAALTTAYQISRT